MDVTRAPSWSGAINDGKLRIPVSGVQSVTPELARVLKHELTHSFISQMSSNRCPTWLNEGIAQMEEGKSSARTDISWPSSSPLAMRLLSTSSKAVS